MKTKPMSVPTEKMLELYNSGLSGSQIAKQFGLQKSAVTRRLKKAGVKLRSTKDYEGEKRYWLWKGENYIDPVTRKRNQRNHRIWSKAVMLRDGNACVLCGGNQKRLEAHHVVALKDCINSNLEFDVSNGVTLCSQCHRHIHKEIRNLTKNKIHVYRIKRQRQSKSDRT